MESCFPYPRRTIRTNRNVLRPYQLSSHLPDDNDLYLKPEKCDFKQKEIDYLGVIVGNGKLQMDLKKLKGVADWPKPNTPIEICKFLGFTGYYRYFIQGYLL